jgi:hypothetical protein
VLSIATRNWAAAGKATSTRSVIPGGAVNVALSAVPKSPTRSVWAFVVVTVGAVTDVDDTRPDRR